MASTSLKSVLRAPEEQRVVRQNAEYELLPLRGGLAWGEGRAEPPLQPGAVYPDCYRVAAQAGGLTGSGCVASQGRPLRTMALRIVSNFRIQAVSATFFGFPD